MHCDLLKDFSPDSPETDRHSISEIIVSSLIVSSIINIDLNLIFADSLDNKVYSANDGGLYYSDDDGNNWYEVDYLAQDSVFQDMENTPDNDPDLATFSDQSPYLLKLLKTLKIQKRLKIYRSKAFLQTSKLKRRKQI